ncbi:MAG: aldehyde ferredoxin oxidoreductase N-terminal domain-containing protein, partial [Dehalococcoidia bacterium]
MESNVRGAITGKILRVNLGKMKAWVEDTHKYGKDFLGGRTLASYILLTEMSSDTTWSDPGSMIIFSPGILDGTAIPGASRTSVDGVNVFNNGKGSSNFGGNFGPALKLAGYDMLIITGQAEKPVYLWIHEGGIEFKDASAVWGKKTLEVDRILRQELQDEKIEIACIGPAGENIVKSACIIGNCGKAAGGSGLGCILGQKRLKAIAVHGKKSVALASSPKEFRGVLDRVLSKISNHPPTKVWQEGTLVEAVE